MSVNVKVVKMFPDVKLPEYATDGSGCFDIYAYEPDFEDMFVLLTSDCNKSDVFHTGLKVEVPEGYVLMIYSRSGQGFNNSVRLANCVGVIDSDYRGEIKVKLTADRIDSDYMVFHGQAIAQGMIIPIPKVGFEVVESLSDTGRGSGGFGSTDKKVGAP